MASFNELIKSGKIEAAFLQKQVAAASVDTNVQKISKLDQVNPNARTFSRLEQAALKSIDTLNAAVDNLNSLLLQVNPEIVSDVNYLSDRSYNMNVESCLHSVIDNYIELLDTKGINYPPDVKPSTNQNDSLTEVLKTIATENTKRDKQLAEQNKQITVLISNLSKNQSDNISVLVTKHDENIKKLTKTNSSIVPRPTQPLFKSRETDADYELFSDFLPRFKHFVSGVKKDVNKLEWLKSSISGDAQALIKNLSLEDVNYAIALKRLEDKYLNNEYIKEKLITSILKFKCDNKLQISKIPSMITSLCNDLDELKNSHEIDPYEGSGGEFVRHILYHGLPDKIRSGLIQKLNKNYPSLKEILDNFQFVVNAINLSNSSNPSSSSASGNPVSNPAHVTTFNVHSESNSSHKKTFKQDHKQKKKRKCLFCSSTDHHFWKCNIVRDKDDRTDILKKDFPENCIKCGWAHKKNCNFLSFCNRECKQAHGDHCRVFCPKNLQPKTAVNQVTTLSVVSAMWNIPKKAVALPTAVFSANNDKALALSPDMRNISVMLDSGAQRSLISRDAATRLGLDIIGKDKASLLGYGSSRAQNNIFDVAAISLGRLNDPHPVKLDAYVVNKLNPLHMAGASAFSRKLQKMGVQLADWRLYSTKSDIVNFDLLVGCDYFYKVIDPAKLPIQRQGMYLKKDFLGRSLLCGMIPGSANAKLQEQVNVVSIQHISSTPKPLNQIKTNIRPGSPILDDNENICEGNAFDVARELNNMDAVGFHVSTRQEDDREALQNFKSNMFKDESTNQYIVGFPWVNDTPPTQEELDSNYGLVLAKFKDNMRSLDKNPSKLMQYKETHDKEVSLDFVEKVPLNELKDRYI